MYSISLFSVAQLCFVCRCHHARLGPTSLGRSTGLISRGSAHLSPDLSLHFPGWCGLLPQALCLVTRPLTSVTKTQPSPLNSLTTLLNPALDPLTQGRRLGSSSLSCGSPGPLPPVITCHCPRCCAAYRNEEGEVSPLKKKNRKSTQVHKTKQGITGQRPQPAVGTPERVRDSEAQRSRAPNLGSERLGGTIPNNSSIAIGHTPPVIICMARVAVPCALVCLFTGALLPLESELQRQRPCCAATTPGLEQGLARSRSGVNTHWTRD